jgi:hypothetical protein
MKTAVEWFEDRLTLFYDDAYIQRLLKEAKEMEKKQRQEDTNYGYSQGWDDGNQNKEPMRPELKQQEQ